MKFFLSVLSAALLLQGCQNFVAPPPMTISGETVTLNPSGIAPLTALLEVQTDVPVRAVINVEQKFMGGGNENSAELPQPTRPIDSREQCARILKCSAAVDDRGDKNLTHHFAGLKTTHRLPILGLYADYTNTVRITFLDDADRVRGEREYTVTTKPLPADLPGIRIDFIDREKMADGWTMVTYQGREKGKAEYPYHPFIFDETGEVRWYLATRGHAKLGRMEPGNAMRRLANGNLFFGESNSDRIFEMDMLGNIINEWGLPGFGFHHHIAERVDGNFLLTADKLKAETIEDYVLEVARDDGTLTRVWDLKDLLQYKRRAMQRNLIQVSNADKDWFHGNMVVDLPDEDAYLVSGRVQSAVVKIRGDGEVVWILGPHIGWSTAGNGADLRRRLLQPLDANGVPINKQSVLDGKKAHADFDWNWYQHSPLLMPNGNILIFDNGDNRHFKNEPLYSRAVEYAVDEEAMTVRQVWEWGRQRGRAFFSRYNCGLDYLPEYDHIIISSGRIVSEETGRTGKVVELDYATKKLIFEATVYQTEKNTGWVFHNTIRMPIYPAGSGY